MIANPRIRCIASRAAGPYFVQVQDLDGEDLEYLQEIAEAIAAKPLLADA